MTDQGYVRFLRGCIDALQRDLDRERAENVYLSVILDEAYDRIEELEGELDDEPSLDMQVLVERTIVPPCARAN